MSGLLEKILALVFKNLSKFSCSCTYSYLICIYNLGLLFCWPYSPSVGVGDVVFRTF
jgi:hypothetical protein